MIFDARFEIEHRTGQGGMGTVYRARDRRTGRPVAVKVLHDAEAEQRARFSREARLLAELNHPGIVGYLAHGVSSEGHPYLVMEWLEGHDLEVHLQRHGRLKVETSLAIARRLAEVLRIAHARRILHRDLKPSNIFLRGGAPEGLVLLDFGLARGPGSFTLTEAGVFVGTMEYMAPEQAQGKRELGPTADLYSIGCILFECLTGRPPLVARNVSVLLDKLQREEAPRLTEYLPGAPPALDLLLRRLLAKLPAQRPASAEELLRDLDALRELRDDSAGVLLQSPAANERPVHRPLGEERSSFFSIALVIPPANTPSAQSPPDEAEMHRLACAASALGATLEPRSDGGLLFLVSQQGTMSADEAALRAIRCAALTMTSLPGARAAVCTDRTTMPELQVASGTLNRALELAAAPRASSLLAVDELTARLVDRRCPITQLPTGLLAVDENGLGAPGRLCSTRPELPFVGREQELATLAAGFASCVDEETLNAFLLIADAGAGKSRLCDEFLSRLVARRQVGSILRVHARIDGVLLSPEGPLAAEVLFERLRAEARTAPTVFVFDDLQWSDATSVALFDRALEELRDRAVLVLGLARPEFARRSPETLLERGLNTIHLSALGKPACTQLAQAALGKDAAPETLARLVERSSGNPLYLEELARAADRRSGVAAGLPDALLAWLRDRLARIPPEGLRVLCAASVFGERFWRGAIADLFEEGAADPRLDRGLQQLIASGILRPLTASPVPDGEEYLICDGLLRDAAYALLFKDERSEAHRRAADWQRLRRESE